MCQPRSIMLRNVKATLGGASCIAVFSPRAERIVAQVATFPQCILCLVKIPYPYASVYITSHKSYRSGVLVGPDDIGETSEFVIPKPRSGIRNPFRLFRNTFRSLRSLLEEIGIEIALGGWERTNERTSGRTEAGMRGSSFLRCGDKPEFSHENRRLRGASPSSVLPSFLPPRVSICIEIEPGEPGT